MATRIDIAEEKRLEVAKKKKKAREKGILVEAMLVGPDAFYEEEDKQVNKEIPTARRGDGSMRLFTTR